MCIIMDILSDNSHGIGSIWGQRRLAGGGWIEEVRLQRECKVDGLINDVFLLIIQVYLVEMLF